MKLSSFGELNQIYNFQDTIILCKIFEQRSDMLKKIFQYNLENAIPQVAFLVVSTETKVSVVLCSLQTLSMSEHLKKHY